jgi:DNA-directed RNA polymerase specialized sigma24 family protein
MSEIQPDPRLSQLPTAWTLLFQAHGENPDAAKSARRELLQAYRKPVYRYLCAAVRNPDTADELYQEFALKFVRGDFRRANPDHGRFRDFLKVSLYNLVAEHRRRELRQPAPLAPDLPEPAAAPEPEFESDREFLAVWRAELLDRTWVALAAGERDTGQPVHTVLRASVDHADRTSAEVAGLVAARIGKPLSAEAYRKRLHFARQKFAALLAEQVALTLDGPTPEAVERELIGLELFDYCRRALRGPT